MNGYDRHVLVADVGGAHTYIAIVGVKGKDYGIILKKTYETLHVKVLYHLINDALKDAKEMYDITISRAVISVAGPIKQGREEIKCSHSDLVVNKKEIIDNTMLHTVILLNDFEAVGYGIDILDHDNDVLEIPHSHGRWIGRKDKVTKAVIGAGYGLGMSILHYDSKRHIHVPIASEGGHIDFAPSGMLEYNLEDYLRKHVLKDNSKQPDIERVLSGIGLFNIYNFLRSRAIPNRILTKIDNLDEDAKLLEIEKNYMKDLVCKQTIDLFIRFYAQAARNLALMSSSIGGLYIGGGVALHLKDYFFHEHFMEEFERNDQKSDLLKDIPLFLIVNKDVGLYGCANVAMNFYNLV